MTDTTTTPKTPDSGMWAGAPGADRSRYAPLFYDPGHAGASCRICGASVANLTVHAQWHRPRDLRAFADRLDGQAFGDPEYEAVTRVLLADMLGRF